MARNGFSAWKRKNNSALMSTYSSWRNCSHGLYRLSRKGREMNDDKWMMNAWWVLDMCRASDVNDFILLSFSVSWLSGTMRIFSYQHVQTTLTLRNVNGAASAIAKGDCGQLVIEEFYQRNNLVHKSRWLCTKSWMRWSRILTYFRGVKECH